MVWQKSSFVMSRWAEGSEQPLTWQNKRLSGTFHLRQNLSSMSLEQRLKLMDTRELTPPQSKLIVS